ncbi:hypothetical protein COW81_00555 [Candidatus Campbellbacteria bacterium CG22_combo_CG10-13_8_21_14_all_36_13]|uniref:Cell division protein FtsX n=1 Tax=Candidatus Campbellbacteria bacterium CG22_combo_CG10-13_8_21_14_all_36_13 TaxID=1974529 RepID=A0A2H0DYV0_9BACT|nr:MAG: hypothetical protein COW81_00555 [Candidatus Campbellbacteria bacterium CG22_combo_CG10-13_8_21_14_all_36_13]
MFWTDTKRIIKTGFVSFWRNGVVTAAAVLVMTVTLFVLGSLVFLDAMLDSALGQIQSKVDINVYFTVDAPEDAMMAMKDSLEALPETASVDFVSRDEAVAEFTRKHADDQLILQALNELDDNPLGAHLNIRAKETSQYESIARFLDSENALSSEGAGIIDKINYFQNKTAIDKLSKIITSVDALSFAILIIFIIISIMIVFNTIRLAIYTSKEEISVMQLVGASHSYIRGPFIIEGMMYGFTSALFAMVLFYPVTIWLGPFTEDFFGGTNVFDYYVDNFSQMFLILILAGVVLGAISSFLAIKRYLKL